jgi:hypothetical protein|nr:MAG TPA: excisionase [Bacteriophage sp.]
MTFQEREEIFAKDYLTADDIVKLLGVCQNRAYIIIRNIKRKTDRLGIQGKIHVQDYIDYYGVDASRYTGEQAV